MTLESPDKFFKEGIVTDQAFPEKLEDGLAFTFNASALIIAIDSGGPLEYSFNGKDLHGVLYLRDRFISMDQTGVSRLFLRSRTGVETKYRVWAWIAKG